MSSLRRTLYIGVTNDLERRVVQHKNKLIPGFTSKYNVTPLVYYEATGYINDAIDREKQLKGWTRARKVELIESLNPRWHDLSAEWDQEAILDAVGNPVSRREAGG